MENLIIIHLIICKEFGIWKYFFDSNPAVFEY